MSTVAQEIKNLETAIVKLSATTAHVRVALVELQKKRKSARLAGIGPKEHEK